MAGSPSQTASVQPQLPVGLIDTRAIFVLGPCPLPTLARRCLRFAGSGGGLAVIGPTLICRPVIGLALISLAVIGPATRRVLSIIAVLAVSLPSAIPLSP